MDGTLLGITEGFRDGALVSTTLGINVLGANVGDELGDILGA